MDAMFERLFESIPRNENNGVFSFGNEKDGDCFDQGDANAWRKAIFCQNWRTKKLLQNSASQNLLTQIIRNHEYMIDLACGPGMGLIPSIKQLDPLFPCLASDANSLVLHEWQQYLQRHEASRELDFAQFSVLDLPIKSNTVQAYGSFIGISSTRNGETGYARALSEIHRTLREDGAFYTIETEWADIPAILTLFQKMNRQPWPCFCENQIAWHDRFVQNGFAVMSEEPFAYRTLRAEDNELGAASSEYGIDVGISFTAYIVKKA